MRIKVSNLFGLSGEHTFDLEKGLNIFTAPNAQGVSSVFRSLALVFGEKNLEGALHGMRDNGYVEFNNGKETYYCKVGKEMVERTPLIKGQATPEGSIVYTVVLNENHPLAYWKLSSEGVRSFLTDLIHAEETQAQIAQYEKSVEKKSKELEDLQAMLKEMEDQKIAEQLFSIDEKRSAKRIEKLKVLRGLGVSEMDEQEIEELLPKFYHEAESANKRRLELSTKANELQARVASMEKKHKELVDRLDLDSIVANMEEINSEYERIHAEKATTSKYQAIYAAYIGIPLGEVKCPICAMGRFPCSHNKQNQQEMRRKAEHLMNLKGGKKARLEKRVAELTRDRGVFKRKRSQAQVDIKRSKADLSGMRVALAKLNEDAAMAQREYSEAGGAYDRLRESRKGADRIAKKLAVLNAEDADLKIKRGHLQVLHDEQTKLAGDVEKKEEELKKLMTEKLEPKKQAYEQIVHGAKKLFNQTAKELMRTLDYEGFQGIEIGDDFNIQIDRGGFKQSVATLSTSEATTVAILLTLAAKQNYCPKIPVIAIDTVSTAYDPSRLAWLAKWLVTKVPTVMISTLTPKQNAKGIKILHEL